MEARSEQELDRFDELRDNSEVSVNTAHPQGGNCLSQNPGKGVVDSNFNVHGVENLFVCDASVFPSPITVNPQLTVMALAHYAARRVAAPPTPPRRQNGA
jgi:choline dehydrogenase-like flavoprotein